VGTTTFTNLDLTIPVRCQHCDKRPSWWGMRFGFEKHRIWNETRSIPYQDRYMLCLGIIEIRLHKFWRGDDDRAPHDHPWWFITMPFKSYTELVAEPLYIPGRDLATIDHWRYNRKVVKAWRFHFRPAEYKHIVLEAEDHSTKPFWTFVISGRKTRGWGFWKKPSQFIPHEEWHG
jgi:hypothetical protein